MKLFNNIGLLVVVMVSGVVSASIAGFAIELQKPTRRPCFGIKKTDDLGKVTFWEFQDKPTFIDKWTELNELHKDPSHHIASLETYEVMK